LGLLSIGYQFSSGLVIYKWRFDADIEFRLFYDLEEKKFRLSRSLTTSKTTNCDEGEALGLYAEFLAGGILISNANRQEQLNGNSVTFSGANAAWWKGLGGEFNYATDKKGKPTGVGEFTIGLPFLPGGPQFGLEKHSGNPNYTTE
jgi:hypothetical protein